MVKNIRYYMIADGYRVIFKTPNPLEFSECVMDHLKVMRDSDKENTYTISTMDMTKKDFEIEQRNKALMEKRRHEDG